MDNIIEYHENRIFKKKNHTDDNVRYIETNPYGFGTDPCFFEWDELHQLRKTNKITFRYLGSGDVKEIIHF